LWHSRARPFFASDVGIGGHSRVVAFACKRRGFLPKLPRSQDGRHGRAFCVDHLFPQVPARQYVLSLPYALRFKLAYSATPRALWLGAFISAINSDLRRRARKRKLRGRLPARKPDRRATIRLVAELNVHFHAIVMDGVYAEQPDGTMLFPPTARTRRRGRCAPGACRVPEGHTLPGAAHWGRTRISS